MTASQLTAFGYVAQLPGQDHVLVGMTPWAYITIRIPFGQRKLNEDLNCYNLCACICVSSVRLCVLVSLPAEAVAAQPQLQCVRPPGVVELAFENRVIP